VPDVDRELGLGTPMYSISEKEVLLRLMHRNSYASKLTHQSNDLASLFDFPNSTFMVHVVGENGELRGSGSPPNITPLDIATARTNNDI
jgi:hypothetical protein